MTSNNEHLLRGFKEWLSSKEAKAAMIAECGSKPLAKSMLEDLAYGAGSIDLGCLSAVSSARAGDSWLIVAPGNHGVAAIYPVITGLLSGLKITVRLPKPTPPMLAAFREFLGMQDMPVEWEPNSLRIDAQNHDRWSGIQIYGDDETVRALRSFAPNKISGFGTSVGVTVGTTLDDHGAAALSQDAFALKQKGCLSTRLAVFVSNDSESVFANELSTASRTFAVDANREEIAACHREACRLHALGFSLAGDMPLVAIKTIEAMPETATVNEWFTTASFVLPVVIVKQGPTETNVKHLLDAFAPIAMSVNWTLVGSQSPFATAILRHYPNALIRTAGEANRFGWSGKFMGKALFSRD